MSTPPEPPADFQAHHAELVRSAQAQLGSRYAGRVDASSIVQEVYLDLCRLGAVPDLAQLRLRVRHKVIDAVRKVDAAKRGGPAARIESLDAPAAGPTPSQDAVRREVVACLDEPSDLTPAEAAVLRAHYLEGQTYREIAARLGIPVGSVGLHLAGGLKKLRGRFGGPA